jgi:glycosyltransferase involved in cell wall biosynthesis
MNYTVILCTFNRCQSLPTALESVALSKLPNSADWEVLIVDNNSTDATREIAEQFCRREPNRFRYIFEPLPGKSNALNHGIREAKGEILVFIDDDVTADSHWLFSLTQPFRDNAWAGVGGRILPPPLFRPPSWMALEGPYAMVGVLAMFDRGSKGFELHEPPYGTNMAFRKQVLEKHGGFRTDLGPRPGTELRGEDTEFGRRLLGAGERLWYEPSAVIRHPVPENRLKQRYFLQFLFDHGRSMIRETVGGRPIWQLPRNYSKLINIAFLRLPRRILHWLLSAERQRRFHGKAMVWMTLGQLAELLQGCRHTRQQQGLSQVVDV